MFKYKIVEADGFINIVDKNTNEEFYSDGELYDLNQNDYDDQMNKILHLLNKAYTAGLDDARNRKKQK